MPQPRRSATALLTRVATLCLGLSLFFDQAGAPHGLLAEAQNGPAMTTANYWISLLAPVFFLGALWAASGIFARIDRGDAFGPAMVRGLKEIGACLMVGAWCAVILQPSLIYLIGNGFRQMRGVRLDLSVENLTFGLVGLLLILLARQGQKLKSQLDQFV